MLRSISDWLGRQVVAGDEPVGVIEDALIDDRNWMLRYLVVYGDDRPFLLIPGALSLPAAEEPLRVSLSREQIAGSPPLPEEAITREYELALHTLFGWEPYELDLETDIEDDTTGANEHLRRFGAIRGYALRTPDGRAGQLDDFVVNDENWALFYMVVGSGGLFEEEKQVLLPPTWVEVIADGEIAVELSRETIQKSRPYEPEHLND
jgi:hypothetical protein